MSDLELQLRESAKQDAYDYDRSNPDMTEPACDPTTLLKWRAADRIAELEARAVTEDGVAFRAYCEGYEKGHNDTVESHYAPPGDYPEEWPEIRAALQEGGKG